MKRKFGIRSKILLVMIVLVLGMILFDIEMYQDEVYICENTGSRKGFCKWIMILETNHWYQESPLDSFMKDKYPNELEYRWQFYYGKGKTFGCGRFYEDYYPGPIAGLRMEVLEKYMYKISDEEKKELYYLFSRGNKDEIEVKIDEIWDDYFKDK